MYVVELSQRTCKYLESLDNHLQERLISGLKKLESNPIPSDSKFICRHEGEQVFRIRIGDHRALYKVKHEQNIVLIIKLDKRPRVYS
ncbi:MAG: type II toxin-antitoxin system RelE/ParE family toxin [Nanoarchaeota archaeon]